MKKIKLSIGIPAYNEEKNIGNLLIALLSQTKKYYRLAEVLVISDGSEDNTIGEIKKIKNKLIRIVKHKQRMGVNQTLNEIFRKSHGEVLAIFNADVYIENKQTLDNLVFPFTNRQNIGLVGAKVSSLPPRSYFERIIFISNNFKNSLFDKINKGNNIYNCHGRGRAFSRKFYKKLILPDDCPEDPYAFLACLKLDFKFIYRSEASILFRSPGNFNDHLHQSARFYQGRKNLYKYFSKDLVEKSYNISPAYYAVTLLNYLFINPLEIIAYVILNTYIKIYNERLDIDQSRWQLAQSSKKLI